MALSLRAYAKHRGCTLRAVQEAIAAGRLSKSLVRAGTWKRVRDAAAADSEWQATTYSDRVPLSGPGARNGSAQDAPSPLSLVRARLDAAKAEIAAAEAAHFGHLPEIKEQPRQKRKYTRRNPTPPAA